MFDGVISLKWETVLDDESWEECKFLILEITGPKNYKILMKCKNVEFFAFEEIKNMYNIDSVLW